MPLVGKPLLRWVVDACAESKLLDCAVVATSSMASDLPITEYCYENNIPYHTGSLDDVLDRFYQTAVKVSPSYIVRLTADCPLLTGDIIDRVIQIHLMSEFDYTRNAVDGYDVEVFDYGLLLLAAKLADTAEEREHVTPFMRNGEYNWMDTYIPSDIVGKYSIDTQEDFDKIRGVMEGCIENRKGCLNVL
jgi:spore coat polysaccharide biosynthesis protein SpsF